MREVGSFEARIHLSELLAAVEAGETVTITRRGKAGAGARMTVDEILSARDESRR